MFKVSSRCESVIKPERLATLFIGDGNRNGQNSAHKPVIVRVSHDLRRIPGFSVPRSLPWRESLDRGENVGFDLVRCYLFPSSIEGGTTEGVGLQVANSHIGNHRGDDFTLLETIRRFLGIIGSRSLLGLEGRPNRR
ncbi:hypothetical protein Tco_1001473, partial [Tanacetum coccineum]